MKNSASLLLTSLLCLHTFLQADDSFAQPENPVPASSIAIPKNESKPIPFEPFTGKVRKNKVRVRLQPTYDGAIVKELQQNDLVIVTGETDDFYAIKPPSDARGYIFRTYVLDNVIEGNKVNVRLKPDVDSPVIAQVNSGYCVEGVVDSSNNKWLEIKLPETAHFYIAKEYLQKEGDVHLKTRLDKKRDEVEQLFKYTETLSQTEKQKPFESMNIKGIMGNYQHIIRNYSEFPDATIKAQELATQLEQAYQAKRLQYLESQSQLSTATLEANKKLADELKAYKARVAQLETQTEKTQAPAASVSPAHNGASIKKPTQPPFNMAVWLPVEESLFNAWSKQTNITNPQDFYEEQKQHAFVLKGVIEVYNRPVKNKPGDYMIISTASKLPIAFLYSTHANLQPYVGHEATVLVSPRPNNNFAFPAYFVLSIE